jgi:hypothetical protein
MRFNTTAYAVTTAIIALELFAGGLSDLVRWPPIVAVVTSLGYPDYVLGILGTWKVLAAGVLVAPGLPRLKEWAYAGTVFELTGALASSLARPGGDGDNPIVLAAFILCAMASWALRPADRTLAPPTAPPPRRRAPRPRPCARPKGSVGGSVKGLSLI